VVVDPIHPNKMVGFITKADVLKAYEMAIVRLREEGEEVEGIYPLEAFEDFEM
jgi:hypothetical protein